MADIVMDEDSPDYVHHLSLKEFRRIITNFQRKRCQPYTTRNCSEAVEIKKMSKQLQSFSPSPSSSFLAQLSDTVGLIMSLFSGIKTADT